MITDTDIILRLLVAGVLGGLVGYERERNNQNAGLRTHIILVVGAALAMTLSINLAMQFRPLVPNGDPARLAAQVISGIGFLGVGAIIRYGANIKGLTTATSMWSMAVVGLAVGAGYMVAATFTTVLLLVTLAVINEVEKRFIKHAVISRLVITTTGRRDMLNLLRGVIEQHAVLNPGMSIQKDLHQKRSKFVLTFTLNHGAKVDDLLTDLSQVDGIRSIKYE
jgi:putative Mg2+ transporter-C (MgtC) family protein